MTTIESYYEGSDLGCTYTSRGCTFKLWAPTAKAVHLALYQEQGRYHEDGKLIDHSGGLEIPMKQAKDGVWALNFTGDLAGQYYMYKIEFESGKVHYAVDPYAKAVTPNGGRTAIIDMRLTDPPGWEEDVRPPFVHPVDAVLYELHIRDFSISEDSGMHYKGKYLAFTEEGLTDKEGNPIGIDHLVELGITHVHLLPIFDFGSLNELDTHQTGYNWGYDPQFYNVPEGTYATDASDPYVRIRELKQMIQTLHRRGIRVIMDVVYNHTLTVDDGPFEKVVPGYYYRRDHHGNLSNGSGVGNELATERPMVRRFIKDSVRHWAAEYHLDGFRFDLMGLIDTRTMEELTEELRHEIDDSLLFYGEPWTGGESPLTDKTLKGAQRGKGFAVFNDNFRGAIKGDSDGAGRGFATGQSGQEEYIITGVMGAIHDFTDAPSETINYVTVHDNLNLWDKVLTTQGLRGDTGLLHMDNGRLAGGGSIEEAIQAANPYKHVDLADPMSSETVRRSLLANGIVLTSQGIPLIHAGDELLRSKYGDHNSYQSGDLINAIRWSNKAAFHPVFDYYRGLIQLRRQHPAFRLRSREQIERHIERMHSGDQVVAYLLKDHAGGDEWRNIIVIYNANTHPFEMPIPDCAAGWKVVVHDRGAGVEALGHVRGGHVSVPWLSMLVLAEDEHK